MITLDYKGRQVGVDYAGLDALHLQEKFNEAMQAMFVFALTRKPGEGLFGEAEKVKPLRSDIKVRRAYIDEVKALKNLEESLGQAGKSHEQIARALYKERRNLGIKYKSLTSPDVLVMIYKRNIDKYGDPLGPTIEYLRSKGYSWEDIIQKAQTPGNEYNKLAGIK